MLQFHPFDAKPTLLTLPSPINPNVEAICVVALIEHCRPQPLKGELSYR